jgi:uncharacterized membrane protein YeaQ/YmgE (transglycosylase-associated protein family)
MPDLSQQNLFIWIVIGGMFGWIADAAFKATRLGAAGNIVAGIIGAFLGTLVFNAFSIHLDVGNEFFNKLLIAFIGTLTLLALLSAAERASR